LADRPGIPVTLVVPAFELVSDVLVRDVAAHVSREHEKLICEIVVCVGVPAEDCEDDKAGEQGLHRLLSWPAPV
jgi:hypothetical protein